MSLQSRSLIGPSGDPLYDTTPENRPVRVVFGWVRHQHTTEFRVLFEGSDVPETITVHRDEETH